MSINTKEKQDIELFNKQVSALRLLCCDVVSLAESIQRFLEIREANFDEYDREFLESNGLWTAKTCEYLADLLNGIDAGDENSVKQIGSTIIDATKRNWMGLMIPEKNERKTRHTLRRL